MVTSFPGLLLLITPPRFLGDGSTAHYWGEGPTVAKSRRDLPNNCGLDIGLFS